MHGRPRAKHDDPEDPQKIRKQKQKAALIGQLMAAVLSRRAEKRYDAESMALSANLLCLNPEVYTVWNYRREALLPVLKDPSSNAAREAVEAELKLTQEGLKANPKSYAAWHHRGWVVEHGKADLQRELTLVQELLSLDDRNFHGWAYWRWLVQKARELVKSCLEFSEAKLRANFSNYSAWHARSALLAASASPAPVPTLAQLMAGDGGSAGLPPSGAAAMLDATCLPQEELNKEFDLVHKAWWTEPKDQSAWLYHRWLLGSCLASAGVATSGDATHSSGRGPTAATGAGGESTRLPPASDIATQPAALDALDSRLQAEAAMCEQLIEDAEQAKEPKQAKWPLLTLARVCEAAAAAGLPDPRPNTGASGSPGSAGQQRLPKGAAGTAAADSSTAERSNPDGTHSANSDSNSSSREPNTAVSVAGKPTADALAERSVGQLYEQLAALDPMRAGYYRDAAAGRAHVVLRATVA